MNDYIETRLQVTPCSDVATDILAAMLADVGYESFVPDTEGLTAFIKRELHDAAAVEAVISDFPLPDIGIEARHTLVEGRDWNAEWERNYFKPIVIGDNLCAIHSSFHTGIPPCRYDIVIDPKMAFGTGHHSTTSLIISRLLEMDIRGRRVLDMGTGTGILAILAAMRGAAEVIGVEIDPFAHTNAVENVALNGHPEIELRLGDVSAATDITGVNLLMANINRNVITADLAAYTRTLAIGADVLLSGFYTEDIPIVLRAAEACGLRQVGTTDLNNWACLHLTLPA